MPAGLFFVHRKASENGRAEPRCCLTSSARSKSDPTRSRGVSDPAIFSQPNEYARLRKDHAETVEVVERFTTYRDVLRRIGEARHILAEGGDRELAELAQAEIDDLTAKQTALEAELKRSSCRAIPTTTGTSSSRFAPARRRRSGALRGRSHPDVTKYAERQRWRVEVMDASPPRGGFKDVILFVQGKGAWSRLKFERGVHRVQRVPVTESSGRIHTSTVTVAVLPEPRTSTSRSRKRISGSTCTVVGAGRAGVNTTDSAVRITHLPTGLV